MGSVYYKYNKRYSYLPDILRKISNDKALGPDNVSDRWLKQKGNA